MSVNLGTGVFAGGDAAGDAFFPGVGNDFEDLRGSNFNDTLTGDANANTLLGLGGNDTIEGGAGADVFSGGAGTTFCLTWDRVQE